MNLSQFFTALENVRVNIDRKHSITYNGKQLYPVYIVLYAQNSIVSKSIRRVTKAPYSHASISFDTSMTNIFSFGRLKIETAVDHFETKNGAIRESFVSKLGMRKFPKYSLYEIYVIFVTEEDIINMKKRIHEIYDDPEKYRFSFIGLAKYLLGIPSKPSKKMFCSQFVASLLSTGGVALDRSPSLYSPYEIKDIKNVIFVENGILCEYNRKKMDERMTTICENYEDIINADVE